MAIIPEATGVYDGTSYISLVSFGLCERPDMRLVLRPGVLYHPYIRIFLPAHVLLWVQYVYVSYHKYTTAGVVSGRYLHPTTAMIYKFLLC